MYAKALSGSCARSLARSGGMPGSSQVSRAPCCSARCVAGCGDAGAERVGDEHVVGAAEDIRRDADGVRVHHQHPARLPQPVVGVSVTLFWLTSMSFTRLN